MDEFIPVNQPLLDGNEKRYLAECIETGWISSEGPFVERFESEFARRVGRKYGIAVANGSVAIDAAVAALGIGAGDEVIMPTFTIISCAAAVVRAGAVPALVDCNRDTWNMNVREIESRISPRTKAIMVVHIYGLPVDMGPLMQIAERYGLAVIEDAAEMHGQYWRDRPCGSFGSLSTFSFYPNKHVTTGEGGMIVTDDPALAERCRRLRNLCFEPGRRFIHEELGWNFRMTNMQAALGLAQLERLEEFVVRKRAMGERYIGHLAGLPGVQLPVTETEYARNIYWVFGIVLDDDVAIDASEAISRLGVKRIGARPFFWPMHEQPVFRKRGLFRGERYPEAERIARRGFYLPSGLALTTAQIDRAAARLREVLDEAK
jgi:perosamine synthetase